MLCLNSREFLQKYSARDKAGAGGRSDRDHISILGEDNAEKIREETVEMESYSQGISNFENKSNSTDDDKGGTSVGEI